MNAQIRLCQDVAGLQGEDITEEQARSEIVASIDHGIPVIAMGIIGPQECCVVHGYCDALCQVHERGVALPYYQRLADAYPE